MSTPEIVESDSISAAPRGIRILKRFGWIAAFFGLLIVFTLAKLPDDRIGGLILEKASEALSARGHRIEMTAERTRISLLLLGRIRFEGLSLRMTSDSGKSTFIRWNEARLSPSFIDLLLTRMGGTIKIEGKDGSALTLAFWTTRSGKFSFSAKMDRADLGIGGIGLLPMLAEVEATLPLSGTIELSGDGSKPTSLSGKVQLTLAKSEIPGQRISGFPIPSIRFSDGEVRSIINSGVVKVESLRVGKLDRNTDDLAAVGSGEITLSSTWEASQLNLQSKLRFSESVLKSLVLLDALLGAGKQPDGSYSIRLIGPIYAPQMQPGGGSP